MSDVFFYYWASRGPQLWIGLSPSKKKTKKQKGGPLTQRALRVPLQWGRFFRGGDGHFRSMSDEQIWESIWNEHKIISRNYWPYIYA